MPKRFFIIDGHAHIFRAYFAPFRDLTSPTGEPTKATYVFTQMLMNLVENAKPDYLAMVIDHGDETVFRKDIYPEYKANRQPVPDDFHPQEARILQIVKDAGVPLFELPGYEADDLIATMADKLGDKGFEVFIVSKDKDLRQLLTESIHMFDAQTNEVIDIPKMIAKVGYGPERSLDVQTLMGDAIDNVPGIPGVGEKTAVKLLEQYGSIPGILENIDKLTPKMKENFINHKDKLELSRKLVTLHKDVKFDWSIEGCEFKGFNLDGLKKHLVELNFRGLLGKLPADAPVKTEAPKPKVQNTGGGLFDFLTESTAATPTTFPDRETSRRDQYTLINTSEVFDAFLNELKQQKSFAFDTETDNLSVADAKVVGMSFSWKSGTGWYLPLLAPAGAEILDWKKVIDALKPILENPKIGKVGHNIKYDILAMINAGVRIRGVTMDTMIASFLVDASRMTYGIDRLALDLLNFKKIPTSDLLGTGKKQITMNQVDLPTITHYASEDSDIAWRLHEIMSSKLDALPLVKKLHEEIELPLIDVLVDMEYAGIAVDAEVLKTQSVALGKRIDQLRDQIHQLAGEPFNIDSPKQLADLLFNKLQLKSVKKTKTGFSTDIEVLERLASEHPVPKLVLEYRQLVKLKGTYLDALTDHVASRDGRIHTSFNQTGAATGRLSSSDPNLQNIPIRTDEGRAIRQAFIPGEQKKHSLLTADYSQIELRVLAHLSEEPALMKAFHEGADIHATVAAEVFGVAPDQVSREQRAQAKVINFGIIYGITAQGLARRIDGMNIRGADELIKSYNKRFSRISTFMDECVQKARSDGYVETITGRRRPVFDITSAVIAQRNAAERVAINSVVQGSAADLIKIAMVNIHRSITTENRDLKMLLQVHDELVFETPDEEVKEQADFVRKMMVSAMTLKVPLEVEVGYGKNWQEVK